jgi:hypothetical protein
VDDRQDAVGVVDRRRFMAGATAALTSAGLGAALGWPGQAVAATASDPNWDTPVPKPIPGGVAPGFHVWVPGPRRVTLPFSRAPLAGLNVDPSTITDFEGTVALAYHAGTARGSDGRVYNLETDIRAFAGTYVAVDGSSHEGSFVYI